mgnify:CR=1 FL=1|jgi:hypothetical protein
MYSKLWESYSHSFEYYCFSIAHVNKTQFLLLPKSEISIANFQKLTFLLRSKSEISIANFVKLKF